MRYATVFPVLLLVVAPVATGGEKDPTKKIAETPDEAVQYFAEAARAKDLDGAFAQLTEPYRLLLGPVKEIDRLKRNLDAALDEKFGKAEKAGISPGMKEMLAVVRAMAVVGKKDLGDGVCELRVRMTLRQPDGKEEVETEPMLAVKERDGWKLTLKDSRLKPGEDPRKAIQARAEEEKRRFSRMKAGMEQLIKDVKEGKYTSRQEAEGVLLRSVYSSQDDKEAPRGK